MPGHRLIVGERLIIGERLIQGGIPDVAPSNAWFSAVSGGGGTGSTGTVTIAGLDSGVSIVITADNDNATIVEDIVVNNVSQGTSATVQNGDQVRIDYITFGSGSQVGSTVVRNQTDANDLLNTHSVSLTGGGL